MSRDFATVFKFQMRQECSGRSAMSPSLRVVATTTLTQESTKVCYSSICCS